MKLYHGTSSYGLHRIERSKKEGTFNWVRNISNLSEPGELYFWTSESDEYAEILAKESAQLAAGIHYSSGYARDLGGHVIELEISEELLTFFKKKPYGDLPMREHVKRTGSAEVYALDTWGIDKILFGKGSTLSSLAKVSVKEYKDIISVYHLAHFIASHEILHLQLDDIDNDLATSILSIHDGSPKYIDDVVFEEFNDYKRREYENARKHS